MGSDMPSVGPRPAHEPACGRPDLNRRLPEWDSLEPRELAALEAHAAQCARCRRELELLRRADAWLAELAPPGSAGSCPEPDLLYAVSGGPGAEPVSAAERAAVEEHVTRCAECAGFAATLQSRPPSPLVMDPEPSARPVQLRRVGSRRPAFALTALAAAAGLILGLALWRLLTAPHEVEGGPSAGVPRFPEAPVLRGDLGGPLQYPRNAVLARADGQLAHDLVFEIEPQADATSYRIDVFHAEGGERLLHLKGAGAQITASERTLAPGRYTYEVWAEVRGLDVPLGRRDFEVRPDAEVLEQLAALESRPEPERSEKALQLLVERGYDCDARAWARTLPASPERDAFLARSPGR
jgi:anti-sigma factor RsiW